MLLKIEYLQFTYLEFIYICSDTDYKKTITLRKGINEEIFYY